MNNNDERDYAEEAANSREMTTPGECSNGWHFAADEPTGPCPGCGDRP